MARIRRPEKEYWPSWRYGPDGHGEIFQSTADVPFGWTEKPGQVFEATKPPEPLNQEELEAALRAKGIEPHPTWSNAYMKELVG